MEASSSEGSPSTKASSTSSAHRRFLTRLEEQRTGIHSARWLAKRHCQNTGDCQGWTLSKRVMRQCHNLFPSQLGFQLGFKKKKTTLSRFSKGFSHFKHFQLLNCVGTLYKRFFFHYFGRDHIFTREFLLTKWVTEWKKATPHSNRKWSWHVIIPVWDFFLSFFFKEMLKVIFPHRWLGTQQFKNSEERGLFFFA